jgi:hypothetical protein
VQEIEQVRPNIALEPTAAGAVALVELESRRSLARSR